MTRDAYEYGESVFGMWQRNKAYILPSLIVWIVAILFIIVFRFGRTVQRMDDENRMTMLLAAHRQIVMQETIDSVNRLSKNRGKFERLKFRASIYGVSLEL